MKLTNEMEKAAKSEEEVMELINSSLAELSDSELSKVVGGAGHDYDNYSMAETCK